MIEIVDAHNPQILLGEINIEAPDADRHARLFHAAPDLLKMLQVATKYLRRDIPAAVVGPINDAIAKASGAAPKRDVA
jgi:hypothetical protein